MNGKKIIFELCHWTYYIKLHDGYKYMLWYRYNAENCIMRRFINYEGKVRPITDLSSDPCARLGWVVNATPQPLYLWARVPVPILQEVGWASGPVWTGTENFPHLRSNPEPSSCSESLHRLSYPVVINLYS